MLQSCYRKFSKLLPEIVAADDAACYKGILECHMGATKVLQRCYTSATKLWRGCYKVVTGVLQKCERSVTQI